MSLRIFWAFDPFDESNAAQKASLAILKWISKPSDSVTAVHVSSPVQVDFAPLVGAPMVTGYQAYPKAEAEAKIKSLKSSVLKMNGLKTEVIESPTASLTGSVRAFAESVSKRRGDLVLVATHARKGMPRFVLGSFAETLIHFSKTDMLLYQPGVSVSGARPRRMVYAHDFTRSGDMGFRRALDYARHWGAHLDIVHIPRPSYKVKFEGEDPKVETYRTRVRAKTHRLNKQLAEAGVTGSVTIVTEWAPFITMITKAARKLQADLIVTTAQTGRFAALLGGSVTRGLVRQSKIPTLVLKV